MLFGSSVAMCFGRKEDRKKNNSAGTAEHSKRKNPCGKPHGTGAEFWLKVKTSGG